MHLWRAAHRIVSFVTTACLAGVLFSYSAAASPIRLGFDQATLGPSDDGTSGPVALGFAIDFLGQVHDAVFVNNNGNVTFDFINGSFVPTDLMTTGRQIIAPFHADVDTRNAGSPVTFGTGTVDGHAAFGVNWLDVDFFFSSSLHTNRNSFQLVLIDRSDTGAGNFDIEFNYGQIQWEAGLANGGDFLTGLGGEAARAGWSNGSGEAGTFVELVGSGVNGAFLDAGPAGTALVQNNLNADELGRYLFEVRNDGVTTAVSVPASFLLVLSGLGMLLRHAPLPARPRRLSGAA